MAKGKNKQPIKIGGRGKKTTIIAALTQNVARAKGIVFVDYKGLTNVQVATLKKGLRDSEAKFMVTKNTLLKRALGNIGTSEEIKQIGGQTASVFLYGDVVTPLKALVKAAKDTGKLSMQMGIMDGKLTTADGLQKLSTLPSRDVLIAQLVGSMKSPIYGLHRALNWNIQKFVMTLNAIQQTKS